MAKTGKLFVIAAPSGAGKTTLVKALLNALPNIAVSISHTTRAMRPGEENGINYHFVDKNVFEKMIAADNFLEYATVFENYYGTSKATVEKMLASGTDVILEIDWQGHQQIKRLFPDAISIFIAPPSIDSLRERLTGRAQDSAEIIKKRLADAEETLSHAKEFEHIVVNDDFEEALSELKEIIKSNR